MSSNNGKQSAVDFVERVRVNQRKLTSGLKSHYDFIVCGSGSSGSVVARRLAENPDVSVLLLEAGGSDDVPSVTQAARWFENLGTERDWNFVAQPNPHLNGRSIPLNMGKVLGGGSSINVMAWARGHKHDWDFFASESGDTAWNYESVLEIYRRMEDWQGAPDPTRRGTGGLVFVQSPPDPNPIAPAMLEAARSVGMPTFDSNNGALMEGNGGASLIDLRVRDGKRLSVFRTYVFPYMDQPNLTVLTHALVTKLTLEGRRATGVEIAFQGKIQRITAGLEVVLSLGAMHTPKVLMLSGIGDQGELQRLGIPVVQHLPGVGQNFQDHFGIGCIWEYQQPLPIRNNGGEATFFWKSSPDLDTPDLQTCLGELPYCTAETAAKFNPPPSSWTLFGCVVRPKSRGQIRLTGPNPDAPVQIEAHMLADPDDMNAAIACVEFCREIGNSAALQPFRKREVMPGNLTAAALKDFIRDAATTYHHQTCTSKMGRDSMSVVDAQLKVYGIENLRVADGSIMPRVTTGNTMAPCIVIGERAAEALRNEHRLETSSRVLLALERQPAIRAVTARQVGRPSAAERLWHASPRSTKRKENERRTKMSEIPIGVAALEDVVLTVLTHLNNGEIDDVIARFAGEFTFKDHGIGLEFKDRERLADFFQKAQELYPDSLRRTNTIFVSGDHVITEWTLQATLTEPFYGLLRKVPVSVHGTSIVRIDDGKITDWADYYDGLTSRRTAQASHFTEWVEL